LHQASAVCHNACIATFACSGGQHTVCLANLLRSMRGKLVVLLVPPVVASKCVCATLYSLHHCDKLPGRLWRQDFLVCRDSLIVVPSARALELDQPYCSGQVPCQNVRNNACFPSACVQPHHTCPLRTPHAHTHVQLLCLLYARQGCNDDSCMSECQHVQFSILLG
jgi:hypothetical protein